MKVLAIKVPPMLPSRQLEGGFAAEHGILAVAGCSVLSAKWFDPDI